MALETQAGCCFHKYVCVVKDRHGPGLPNTETLVDMIIATHFLHHH